MKSLRRRNALGLWLAIATVTALAWLALHGSQLKHMGNSIVLEWPPSRDRVTQPLESGQLQPLVLSDSVINFRPDLLPHPFCVVLVLHPGRAADGRLRIALTADSGNLFQTQLDARSWVDGPNRVCTDLPLETLQKKAILLNVDSDPQAPVKDVAVATRRPASDAPGISAPVVRLEAHVPWSRRQVLNAAVVACLVLAVLWQVIQVQSVGMPRVK